MKDYSELEIQSLIKLFESKTLPKKDWTHEAHLIVGVWYSFKNNFEQTLDIVRNHIKKFNIATGTPNTDTSGYHETITYFWLVVINKLIEQNRDKSVYELCNLLIKSDDSNNDYFLNFYTKELLFSVKARKEFVPPNIKNFNL